MRRWHGVLVVVCLAHALGSILLVGPHLGLEWDETVYVSQLSAHAPAGVFTAPRARGMTLLVAPVTSWSSSVALLRVWLSILSGLLTYTAFRPWLTLRPAWVAPAAAALFGTLWVTIFFGAEAMPNLYVACAAVGAVGQLLAGLRSPRGIHLVGLVGWLALAALMRPADALMLAVPCAVAALLPGTVPTRWRAWLIGAVVAGVALGCAEWVVEAYVRFGGLGARIHAASAEQGSGLHFALPLEARAAAGPNLCRPCTAPYRFPAFAWWLAVPPLLAAGVLAARKTGDVLLAALPMAAAVTVAIPYVLTIDYAAPRFLLPSYALLALPCAEALWWLTTVRRPRLRTALIAGAAVAAIAHVAVQLVILEAGILPASTDHRLGYVSLATDLRKDGVRSPCLVAGHDAPPVAFDAGCGNDSRVALLKRAARDDVSIAVLATSPAGPGAYFSGWPRHRLRGPHLHQRWYAYVEPR